MTDNSGSPQPKVLHYAIILGDDSCKRYAVIKEYKHATGIVGCPFHALVDDHGSYVHHTYGGLLMIGPGVSWDGPSGPAVDTVNFMRASLVHDTLYGAIERGDLPKKHRKDADRLMRQIAREDGMSAIRAWYAWLGVRLAGWMHV